MPFNLTGKIHDLIATLTAGSVVAVALSDLDVARFGCCVQWSAAVTCRTTMMRI